MTGFNSTSSYALEVTPSSLYMQQGDVITLRAHIVDGAGRTIENAITDYVVSWHVSDSTIVRVTSTGPNAVVYAVGTGTMTIDAEATPISDRDPARGPLKKPTKRVNVRSRRAPARLEAYGGNGQSGASGSQLASPVSVRLLDTNNAAIMGARVDFVAESEQDNVMPSSAETDINGIASTLWTLGPQSGTRTLRAKHNGVDDLILTATGTAAAASTLTVVSGNGQQAQPGQELAPLHVRLTDASGLPVQGGAVIWSVTAGGGGVTPVSSTTDSTGHASTVWTVGPSAGTQTVLATHGSFGGDFTATVTAGPAAQVVRLSGDAQSATIGTALPDSIAVRVLDAHGNNVPGATVAWTVTAGGGSVSPAQGQTSSDGVARTRWTMGASEGSASLRASVQGTGDVTFSATALATDAPPPPPSVARVVVTPATLSLSAIGATGPLAATAYDGDTNVVSGADIAWTSLNTSIATVDTAGMVTARGVGSVLIIAASVCCGPADTAAVTVTQTAATLEVSPRTLSLVLGTTGDLTATVRDANGNVIAAPSVSWSSSDTTVATVSAGRVTASAAGTAVIRAESGTVQDSALVTITNPVQQVSRVEVTPSSAAVDAIGAQVTLAAVAYDANNQVVLGADLHWSTLSSTIATVDSMGLVTARGVGTALIVATAACCSAADSTSFTVTQRVASLDVSPATLSLSVGASQWLSVTALDANQNVVPSPSVTWSTSSSAVATVSSGEVTAVAAGSAVIRAVSGDARDSTMVTVTSSSTPALDNECSSPQSAWIWCDDFSENRLASYFEYDNAGGRFVRESAVGVNGTTGMRATFASGQSGAGSMKLAFGATPSSYFKAVDAGTAKYREIYWRVFVRNAPDWTGGGGDKLSRAIVFASSNWAEAAIGHVWSGGSNHNYLLIDPVSGTDTQGTLKTTKYNDFDNMRWLGSSTGTTPLFSSTGVGQWYCVETRMRLNDADQSNGVFEMWINGQLDAQRTGLNWLGSYATYGINALFLENFWNNGSPKQQSRYFDNLVVSTQPIGCGGTGSTPPPPTGVASVTVTPSSASLTVGETSTFSAVAKDASGNTISGATFTWSSSNTSVASVSTSGLVTTHQAGSATITATVDGTSGSAALSVTATSSSPWLEMNFDAYATTEELLGDCQRWNCVEQSSATRIILDANVAPPGGNRSMRYHYRHDGDGCNSITIKRTLPAPARTQEVWAEFQARWSANFRTTNDACAPNDHKFIFGDTEADGNGRWAFYVGSDTGPHHTLMVERPLGPNGFLGAYYPNSSNGLRASDLWDGEWHTVRLYYRASSGPSTTDGAMKVWVDGVLIHSETGFATRTETGGRDYITGFSFSHNKDDGPANEDMYLWWGRIRYWQANPGW